MEKKMRNLLPALAGIAILFGVVNAAAQDMNSKEIKKLISGKRVVLATKWGAFPLVYKRNGRVSGDGTGLGLAKYAAPKETGSWWVSGNQMCQKFPTWYKGKRQCFRLKQIGPTKLKWHRHDGYSGTATISG